MDQLREDFKKETGEEVYLLGEILILNPFNTTYVEYLENRLKQAEEKVKNLIIYTKTL